MSSTEEYLMWPCNYYDNYLTRSFSLSFQHLPPYPYSQWCTCFQCHWGNRSREKGICSHSILLLLCACSLSPSSHSGQGQLLHFSLDSILFLPNNSFMQLILLALSCLVKACFSTRFCWVFTPKKLKTLTHKDMCIPISIALLFAIGKTWKQLNCPLTDNGVKKMWYICTMEYYSAKNNTKYCYLRQYGWILRLLCKAK